ncbi:hypothetical protein [Afipia clevelandensis]|uniref:Uncharacterized protein n=1 Tax=Afipia clevelandensis ATCC 49720 TaxID=883079 RepID=K8P3S7_9BRAD|nr:hypothetical protein [Afipia clevelandensis]EKS35384.1 hypothetical protein HMPREF9696_02656 [Afipia clevelandensis ATCC 49720]
MAIDWLKSSNKQRVDLYDAVMRLIKLKELTWADLYEKALRRAPNSVGPAFNENFRKGKISAANAALVFQYIADRHPHVIPDLNAAVSTAREFREFLLYYRRLGAIELLPRLIGKPFRVNRLGPEWHEYPFETTEPVCFRLDLPYVYPFACALNWTNEGWFPMALAEPSDYELESEAPPPRMRRTSAFIKPVTQGAQHVCTLPPTEQEERRRRYENSFVFLVGELALMETATVNWNRDRRINDADLDSIASTFRSEHRSGWCVTLINAHGIAQIDDN